MCPHWPARQRSRPARTSPAQDPPTGRTSLRRGVHADSRRCSSLPRLWTGPTRLARHRGSILASVSSHHPSPSAPTLPDPTLGLFTWLATPCPRPRSWRETAGGTGQPQFLWRVVAIHSGLRGPERTRTATAHEATLLDARRDSVSGPQKTLAQQKFRSRQCKIMFAHCQRNGSNCDTIQARTLVLPGACVRKEKDVVERKSQRTPKENGTVSHCRRLTSSQVSHFTSKISSDRIMSA